MGSQIPVQEGNKIRLEACPEGPGVEALEMKLEHHGAEDLEADGHLRAVQARRESDAMREPPLLEAIT